MGTIILQLGRQRWLVVSLIQTNLDESANL